MSDRVIEFRYYQEEAINAALEYDGSNVIVIPTGGGKSLVMGGLADRIISDGGRVVIIADRKELVEQNLIAVLKVNASIDVGVYHAGIGKRDVRQKCLVAGIHSIYNKIIQRPTCILIDEAHKINPENEGMYREFLSLFPDVKVIGLTATEFRSKTGYIYKGSNSIFKGVSYRITMNELIDKGYLSKMVSFPGSIVADMKKIGIRNGEFITKEMEVEFSKDDMVNAIASDVMNLARRRKSIIIFCSGVGSALKMSTAFKSLGEESVAVVTGNTSLEERSTIVSNVKSGRTRITINCNVFTVGFDAPNIDCVVLARATTSIVLLIQMIGRGMRIHKSKDNCLLLDYGKNIFRHGRIGNMKPNSYFKKSRKEGNRYVEGGEAKARICPNPMCRAYNDLEAEICCYCGCKITVGTEFDSSKLSEDKGINPMTGKSQRISNVSAMQKKKTKKGYKLIFSGFDLGGNRKNFVLRIDLSGSGIMKRKGLMKLAKLGVTDFANPLSQIEKPEVILLEKFPKDIDWEVSDMYFK